MILFFTKMQYLIDYLVIHDINSALLFQFQDVSCPLEIRFPDLKLNRRLKIIFDVNFKRDQIYAENMKQNLIPRRIVQYR